MHLTPYVLICILGGLIVPIQLAIIGAFTNTTNASQIQSTFYLYIGGAITSFFLSIFINGSIIPPLAKNASWWMWIPGFLGSFYILFMFIATPKIGAANTILLVFLGQVIFSIILDNTGFLGLEARNLDIFKLLGIVLILAGTIIMLYSES